MILNFFLKKKEKKAAKLLLEVISCKYILHSIIQKCIYFFPPDNYMGKSYRINP